MINFSEGILLLSFLLADVSHAFDRQSKLWVKVDQQLFILWWSRWTKLHHLQRRGLRSQVPEGIVQLHGESGQRCHLHLPGGERYKLQGKDSWLSWLKFLSSWSINEPDSRESYNWLLIVKYLYDFSSQLRSQYEVLMMVWWDDIITELS